MRSIAPVEVPAIVAAAIEQVRQSGVTNMLDRPRVIELLLANGEFEAAEWITQDRSRYAQLLFNGMIVTEE